MSTEYATEAEPSAGPPAAGLTETVRDQAQSVGEKARAGVREEVDRRSTELGWRASNVAEDLRSVAEHLRSQDKGGAAGLVEQAAQRIAGASGYLQSTDGNRILYDVESLGRRRPWTAIASGLAAGIAASRVLKASSTDRYRAGTAGHVSPAAGAARQQSVRPPNDDGRDAGYRAGAPMDAPALGGRPE